MFGIFDGMKDGLFAFGFNDIGLTKKRTSQALSLLLSTLVLGLNGFYLIPASAANVSKEFSEHSGVLQTTLPTGHTLTIKEDHAQPIVTIDTWVKVGSVNEDTVNNGVSHFLEHLLFKGTTNHPAGYFERVIESRGARFNAATSDDFTHYYITVSSEYFKEAVELHSDMMLNATIPDDELTRERLVVQEEINRSTDNPDRQLFIRMAEKLYGSHGYGLDTLGPKENIANIPRESILNYYHYWYQPKNFNTIITGDVDPVVAKQLVAENFPAPEFTRPLGYNPSEPGEPVAPAEARVEVTTQPNITRGYLTMGLLGPSVKKPEDMVALDIAFLALGGGESSRLYQELKESQQLVTSVGAGNMTQKYSGLLYFSAQTEPEKVAEVQQAILDEVDKIKKNGITEEELNKALVQYENQFVYQNESTQGVASSIGYNVTIGTLDDYLDYLPMLRQVTLDDVQRVFNEYLDFDHSTVVAMVPEDYTDIDGLTEGLRKPFFEAIASSTTADDTEEVSDDESETPEIHKEILDNGATVIIKARPESKTVSVRLFFKGGQLVETIPGTSNLVGSLLTKGTSARSAKQISLEQESKGMSVGAATGEDYFSITGDAISDDVGELFVLLQDVINHPAFDESEIEKEKEHMLKTIQASRDKPSTIAFEALYKSLYPDHPYGYVGEVLEENLPEISRDDIVEYYESLILPENSLAVIVGNIKPDEAKAYLADLFDYKEPMMIADTENMPPVSALSQSEDVREEKEKLAATWIARAWLVPPVDGSDYVPLKVLNSLMGTGMSSRLFVNLREKKGLAYAVGSFYPSRLLDSRLVMYIGTDPKNETEVLKGFEAEVQKLIDTPVDAEELEEAKSKLIGSFALEHETNGDQAFYLGLYETLGVGYEYDKQYIEDIKKVTVDDLQRVAKKYLSAPSVTSIVAPIKVEVPEEADEKESSE